MRYFWLSKPVVRQVNPGLCAAAAAFDGADCQSPGVTPLPQETLEILVMVANDHSAVLCANCNGVTRLIRRIRCRCAQAVGGRETGADYVGRDSNLGRTFARDLIDTLERDVGDHHYDGVIILADASIHDDLCRTPARKVSHLLIAHLIDAPLEFPQFPCTGANAEGYFVQ